MVTPGAQAGRVSRMSVVNDRIVDFLFEAGALKRTPRSGWAFLPGAASDQLPVDA